MHSYIVPVHAEVCTKHSRVPVTLFSSVVAGQQGRGKGWSGNPGQH